MLDGTNTSIQWQRSIADMLILPVGSFEQHGARMPLLTDSIISDYMARRIAEHFDACVLPVISIASSLEHTGFRGSFSLQPETLMQIIRDIADEAEAQNFKYLILVTAHGGNFPLLPVANDINRETKRELKAIFIESGRFANFKSTEIHAGEREMAYLKFIAPELVDDRDILEDFGDITPGLERRDLNTFGMAHFNISGVVGNSKGFTVDDALSDIGKRLEKMIAYIENIYPETVSNK